MVEIDGPVVRLELEGACGSCPSSTMTMKMGLERRLVQRIPEISEVVQSIPNGPELNVRPRSIDHDKQPLLLFVFRPGYSRSSKPVVLGAASIKEATLRRCRWRSRHSHCPAEFKQKRESTAGTGGQERGRPVSVVCGHGVLEGFYVDVPSYEPRVFL